MKLIFFSIFCIFLTKSFPYIYEKNYFNDELSNEYFRVAVFDDKGVLDLIRISEVDSSLILIPDNVVGNLSSDSYFYSYSMTEKDGLSYIKTHYTDYKLYIDSFYVVSNGVVIPIKSRLAHPAHLFRAVFYTLMLALLLSILKKIKRFIRLRIKQKHVG